ncbi:hypothetical protein TgHK011_009657 [Trichoderma gracile]|nr:hypothetical protein TgHK011_009657 [Trichoderma gracile]
MVFFSHLFPLHRQKPGLPATAAASSRITPGCFIEIPDRCTCRRIASACRQRIRRPGATQPAAAAAESAHNQNRNATRRPFLHPLTAIHQPPK